MYLHRPEVHPKDTNTSSLAAGPHTSHHCARLSNSFVSRRGDRRRCHLHRGGLDAPLDGPRELRMWGGCANGRNRRHVPKQREWEWKQSFGGGILIFTKTTIKTGGRNWGTRRGLTNRPLSSSQRTVPIRPSPFQSSLSTAPHPPRFLLNPSDWLPWHYQRIGF